MDNFPFIINSQCLWKYDFIFIRLGSYSKILTQIESEIRNEEEYFQLCMKLIPVIKRRLKFFFMFQIMFILFCVYYVTIFCIVYKGSQVSWITDCLIGNVISLFINLGVSLVFSITRYAALYYRSKYLFNCSLYLNNN